MPVNRAKWVISALAALMLLQSEVSSGADLTETRYVLILNSFDGYASPYHLPKKIFRAALQDIHSESISFREINLESNWGNTEIRRHIVLETIDEMFSDPPLDLIVAMGPPSSNFWLSNRGEQQKSIPFLGMGGENRFPRAVMGPGDAGVVSALNIADFVADFLLLRPATKHILMVFGSSPYERSLAALARSHVEPFTDRIRFEYTSDFSLAELETRLATLESDAAVFYGQLNYDVSGHSLPRGAGLDIVRKASSVPVFGALEDQLGRGIIGGRLIDQSAIGETLADVASKLLRQPNREPSWTHVGLAKPRFDWRELEAFGMDPEALPPGSITEYIPETFWQKYKYWVALVTTQMLLISMLIVARQKQHRMAQSRARLSGKLINAHEDQRKAIARELHDDLSQRLTRLSIDATMIESRESDSQLSSSMHDLRQNLVDVSRDVHDMSYWLHPSILDDLGLKAALQAETEQIARHSKAEIDLDIGSLDGSMTPDAALCLFRIAQEALQNATKHAEATRIGVSLTQKGRYLSLSVRDNGRGFIDREDGEKIGIGLSSMRERARLLGSKMRVSSKPGQGTIISVSIPSDGVNP